MSDGRDGLQYWDIGDEHDISDRKLVDQEVKAALAAYIHEGGELIFDYRKGGTPTICFSVTDGNFDGVPGAHFRRDLGDILLENLEVSREAGPEEMHDLFKELFGVYERWRMNRTAMDPRSSIPVPETQDGKAVDREQSQ